MTFTADQQVKFKGMTMPATIISGPHPTHGAERWLIQKADKTVSLVKAAELSPVLSRRYAVAVAIYEGTTGRRWETSSHAHQGFFRLADKVLAALEAVDADAKTRPLAAGDRIRITRSGLEFASVSVGDELTVQSVSGAYFKTNAPRGDYVGSQWAFALSNEGNGWERV
ncbi:hypothetical protein ACFTXM_09710 [Streptomyces sp. NPDC056930]|uniref:hypothetical protein n=1 Tax=Streptomyces sp. NPDC056930 TaxID=3345967 RepID=UPI0036306E49